MTNSNNTTNKQVMYKSPEGLDVELLQGEEITEEKLKKLGFHKNKQDSLGYVSFTYERGDCLFLLKHKNNMFTHFYIFPFDRDYGDFCDDIYINPKIPKTINEFILLIELLS